MSLKRQEVGNISTKRTQKWKETVATSQQAVLSNLQV